MLKRFMDMKTLTAPVLKELIDRIEVYETEGVGKNRTQRINIYFRFVGQISLPKENKKIIRLKQGKALRLNISPQNPHKDKKPGVFIT